MKEKNKVNLNFIKERRLQLGLTLLEVAHALGLKNAGNYYKYENGEYQLSAAMLPPLAKILNCKIDDFFTSEIAILAKKGATMNELVTVYKDQLVTDSRQVAEHFGKQHQHVIRDIENLVNKAEEKDASKIGRMFFETTMPDAYGRMKRVYLMNRDGFSILVMGFTGAKALEWKLKFLEAFNAMEKAIKTPQITPNPHYRTRMIKTAVKDAADTAAMIADTFGVKKPMAMTAAMQMVGKAYGVDMTPLKQFIPSESNPSTLTPTMIARELGILNSKGNPSPQRVNAMLKDKGLQEKVGNDWAPTAAGKPYCERVPYTHGNGHSGYQLLWGHHILELLKDGDQEAGH